MADRALIRQTFEQGEGILNLLPNFIPRRFGRPGFRLRLHPDDYYPFGTKRGAIKERWFSSTVAAINGPDAPPDEGLSYVAAPGGRRFRFIDAVDTLGAELIGEELYRTYGNWPMFAKFFDYATPLFHHLHLREDAAALVGKLSKPEAYYFPYQLNNHSGQFPVTYFGFDPGVTIEEVRERLLKFTETDTKITELSRAYRLQLGTGWYVPAGVVHAPGSYLTYEPQWNSDVNSVFENVVSGEVYPYDMLVEHCPGERKCDIDYVLSLLDWEKNVDPHFRERYFRPPVVIENDDGRYTEKWITYGNEYFGAKELTVFPGEIGPHCRRGRLRMRRHPRVRRDRAVPGGSGADAPFRPAERRRIFCLRTGGESGSGHHQSQRDRTVGVVETFRAEPSRYAGINTRGALRCNPGRRFFVRPASAASLHNGRFRDRRRGLGKRLSAGLAAAGTESAGPRDGRVKTARQVFRRKRRNLHPLAKYAGAGFRPRRPAIRPSISSA